MAVRFNARAHCSVGRLFIGINSPLGAGIAGGLSPLVEVPGASARRGLPACILCADGDRLMSYGTKNSTRVHQSRKFSILHRAYMYLAWLGQLGSPIGSSLYALARLFLSLAFLSPHILNKINSKTKQRSRW